MQKGIIICLLSGLLTACYCKCTVQKQPTLSPTQPQTQATVLQPSSVETAQTVAAIAATQGETQTVAQTPRVDVGKQTAATAVSTPQTISTQTVATGESVPPAADEPAEAAADTQQLVALIEAQRAAQTLPAPPADTPVFKKEEILPTSGRLLSPLAYEPIHPDTTHAPWSNESLQYGLYYSFIKAGTAYIKTRGITEHNGKKAYLIQTTAFSASVIDSVFKVRDINFSWIDVATHYSLGYAQSLREGNYVRDEWVNFEPENQRYYGEVKKKEDPRLISGKLDQPVLDMLSSLYYVRSQPLEVGKDVTFDIINREERYPLVVKVLGKETVKTKAGKFNCWVVEPQFRGEGIFVAKGKSLKVWLTDDQYRMPVKMSVEVFIGSVYAELLDYQRN